ncbi:MAG: pectin acetylesterase-family hydrolase [Deltaproteobacteria bacterium]
MKRYALPLLLGLAVACGEADRDDDDGLLTERDGGTEQVQDGGETPRDGGMAARDGGEDPGRDGGPNTTGPIEAPFDEWTWVDVPDSRCMNETPTGFGVNIHENATSLVIFLMGGNACFNDSSCFVTANRDGYGASKFANDSVLGAPVFDRSAQSNYLAEWSYVYVPYCSGDVFSGTSGRTQVGSGSYYFQGYDNIGLFLERIVATFPNVDRVLLTGVSAGGFGAMLNFERTQLAFGTSVDVTLIDDSGPPMSTDYLASCLQDHWRNTWGMEDGPLATCPTCVDMDGAFVEGYLDHIKTTFPTNRFGLISSNADEVIRGFFGFGTNNCANLNGLPGNYPGTRFQMGLEDFRDNLVGDVDNFKLYMPTDTRHVWLGNPPWQTTHFGVTLQDWMVDAIEDRAGWSHVPAP